MKSKFHEQFYKTELEVTMGDLAKIVQKPREFMEKYVASLRQNGLNML